jgi:hypothetical protein
MCAASARFASAELPRRGFLTLDPGPVEEYGRQNGLSGFRSADPKRSWMLPGASVPSMRYVSAIMIYSFLHHWLRTGAKARCPAAALPSLEAVNRKVMLGETQAGEYTCPR